MNQEIAHNLKMGLPGASSIEDKTIPTFSRGELPHFAGINTFLKAPYVEDATRVGDYDATVVGIPFDGGCTYRAGTRFGPQGIRRISALYTPYNYEKGIDLREQMTLCDVGDCFTIPANLEVRTRQIGLCLGTNSTTSLTSLLFSIASTRNPLIKSPMRSGTFLARALSPSFSEVTTPLAFPLFAVWPVAPPRTLESSTWIVTPTFKKRTWTSACT
jgi:hypothetical protein